MDILIIGSTSNNTDRHDITEIILKVVLNHKITIMIHINICWNTSIKEILLSNCFF